MQVHDLVAPYDMRNTYLGAGETLIVAQVTRTNHWFLSCFFFVQSFANIFVQLCSLYK